MTIPCIYCGHPADQVDHIVARNDGGGDERLNIVPACKGCNCSKGSRSVEWFLRQHPETLARVRQHQAGIDVLSDLVPGEKPRAEKERLRGQTLRLNPEAWRQLKILAVEQATPSHALLIEAVNDLFRRHGKPPIR